MEPVERRRIQIGRIDHIERSYIDRDRLVSHLVFSECIRLDPARRTEEMRYHFLVESVLFQAVLT